MSRELDILAREFQKKAATVMRKDFNLYQSNVLSETGPFLKKVEQECKKTKQSNVILICVIADE